MQITNIHVENFKSLVDFDLNLAKFTCLIGLNGSGKSTVLQLIDFLAQQMRGKIDDWLKERGWNENELRSKLTGRKNINFKVAIETKKGLPAHWSAVFNLQLLRCTREEIDVEGTRLVVLDNKLTITSNDRAGQDKEEVQFTYEGSILSQLVENKLPSSIINFKNFIKAIHSLDMLSPHFLRQRTRESAGSLGLGGQKLSSFLHELKIDKRHRLIGKLRIVYPHLTDLLAKSLRSGWKQLEIIEDYEGDEESSFWELMKTEARHVNDGMLRLIAILAELQSEDSFLLFDEIENGVNPEIVDFLLEQLRETKKQVLVTTHSPLILNYLDDESVKESVMYIYKTKDGQTKSLPFFSIPSVKKKLLVMGPGEAFVDTKLVELAEEIRAIPEPA